ncbi:cytochrome c oxidase subunit 3 [Flectobacillus major]|jgi:cytochrome c oxidase subunit 3|uniref:cytochrome c oxidase subunit 3 n=1 Tax=Flectobacillus major TaxID=103 RepID=UPI0005C4D2FC|nr:cytochrome c oxidase subunit 3 [Flectobacillus major]
MQRREPFKFMLQLAMFGSGLLFFGLLVFYTILARPNAGFGKLILPQIFWVSTLLMMISSLTLYLANWSFVQHKFKSYRFYMGITLGLGIGFIIMQLLGWKELFELNANATVKTSRGFILMLSGLHIVHIVVGLIFLIKIFVESLKRLSYVESFVYSVNPPNQLKINLIVFYWHFVDVLWVILFAYLWWQNG